jgi:ABC-2 type transport system permease protein
MIDTLTQAEKYVNESEKQRIDEAKKALQYWKNATKTSGEPEILLLTDKGDRSAPVVRGVVYSIINKFNNRLIGAEETIKTSDKSITQRKLKVADYYVPGYIAAFIMTNGVIGVTSVISEYKRNGTIKRLTATPLPKISWIIGNISQQTLLAFALAGIMIILGWLIFGTTAIPDVYAITLMFLGAVAFCGIGIILGGVIKDVEAATGAGNAIAFPMMFLSGAFWPVEMMPDFMQTIAKCLPLYYFHEGLREIMIYQNPSNAILAFIIVGSLAVIFILLAAKITRWKEL